MKLLIYSLFFIKIIPAQIFLNSSFGLQKYNSNYKVSPSFGLKYFTDKLRLKADVYFSEKQIFNVKNQFNFIAIEEISEHHLVKSLNVLPNIYELRNLFKISIDYTIGKKLSLALYSNYFKEEYQERIPKVLEIENSYFLKYEGGVSKNQYLLNRFGLGYNMGLFSFYIYKDFIGFRENRIFDEEFNNFTMFGGYNHRFFKTNITGNSNLYEIETEVKSFLLKSTALKFRHWNNYLRSTDLSIAFAEDISKNLQVKLTYYQKLRNFHLRNKLDFQRWLKDRFYLYELQERNFSLQFEYKFPERKAADVTVIKSELFYPEVFSAMYGYYTANPLLKIRLKNLGKTNISGYLKLLDSDNNDVSLPSVVSGLKNKNEFFIYLNPGYLKRIDQNQSESIRLVFFKDGHKTILSEFPLYFFKKNIWNGKLSTFKYYLNWNNVNFFNELDTDHQLMRDKKYNEFRILSSLIKKNLSNIEYQSDPEFLHHYDEIRDLKSIKKEKKADCEDLVNIVSLIFFRLNYDVYLIKKEDSNGNEDHLYILVDSHIPVENNFKTGFNENMILSMKSKNSVNTVWLALELTEFQNGLEKMMSVGKDNYLKDVEGLNEENIVCLNCQ